MWGNLRQAQPPPPRQPPARPSPTAAAPSAATAPAKPPQKTESLTSNDVGGSFGVSGAVSGSAGSSAATKGNQNVNTRTATEASVEVTPTAQQAASAEDATNKTPDVTDASKERENKDSDNGGDGGSDWDFDDDPFDDADAELTDKYAADTSSFGAMPSAPAASIASAAASETKVPTKNTVIASSESVNKSAAAAPSVSSGGSIKSKLRPPTKIRQQSNTSTGRTSRLQPPTKVSKGKNKGKGKPVAKITKASKIGAGNGAVRSQEDPDSPPQPPSQVQQHSHRRVGPAAGTRSAVKQKQQQKQQAEMDLAQQKFAAAVQKIENEDGEGSNWDFDDELDVDQTEAKDGAQQQLLLQSAPSSKLYDTLVEYIASLSDTNSPMIRSLNAILEAELNTPSNAAELLHYYQTRPRLLQYTLETELSRMDYLIITDQDQFVDKDDIRLYVESTDDRRDQTETVLWCSANQSLLADLIAALTGEDRLIRQRILLTAMAEKCKFELSLGQAGVGVPHSPRCVAAMADLVLSIPSGSGDPSQPRLVLGSVRVRIRFVPEGPAIEYHLVSCTAALSPKDNPADAERLRGAASALERDLAEMGMDGAGPPGESMHHDQLSRTAHDELRDAFLEGISTGASGLRSAWKEFDGVTNVSGKLGWMKNIASALPALPTADDIEALERECRRGVDTSRGPSAAFPRPSPAAPAPAILRPPSHSAAPVPAVGAQPDDRSRKFMDRLAGTDNPSQPKPQHHQRQQAPPKPGTRAMGFLDRLVNELDAPPAHQRQPPPAHQRQPPAHQQQAPRPDNVGTSGNAHASGDARGFLDRLAETPNDNVQRDTAFQGGHRPPPPIPRPMDQQQQSNDNIDRPAPLIGGMLLSGLTRLAQSAAAPDVSSNQQLSAFPRPPAESNEGLQMYRQDINAGGPSRQGNVAQIDRPVIAQPTPTSTHTHEDDQCSPITEDSQDNAEGADGEEEGGWSDEDDLVLDDTLRREQKEDTGEAAEKTHAQFGNVDAFNVDAFVEHRPTATPMGENKPKQPPSFETFADRLSKAAEAEPSVPSANTAIPPAPLSTGASISESGASIGSYTFVSMSSLEKELPELQNWLEVEAVDTIDAESGIVPTRSRWVPRRMRAGGGASGSRSK